MTLDTLPQPLRIFLVEDSPMIQRRLVSLLSPLDGICLVGIANAPQAAVDGIEATAADLAIIDLSLNGGSGLNVLRHFTHARQPLIRIVLTNLVDDAFRQACLDAGADAFFDKTRQFMQVRDAVRQLAVHHRERQEMPAQRRTAACSLASFS